MECGDFCKAYEKYVSWERPEISGSVLVGINLFYLTMWIYDVSLLSLALYSLILTVLGYHAYRTFLSDKEGPPSCCNDDYLKQTLESTYEDLNKALGWVRKNTQGTKLNGLVSGLLILTVIPLSVYSASWIAVNSIFVVKAAQKFAGINLAEEMCSFEKQLSEQFSEQTKKIPRAKSCRKQD